MFNEAENCNHCTICNVQLSGNGLSNLNRHLSVQHKDVFIKYQMSTLNKVKKTVHTKTIKIKVNDEHIRRACVDLVVNDGCTLKLFNPRGFQQLVGPMINALKMTLNTDIVKAEISTIASVIRQKVSRDLKNRLFSLKMDAASRLNKSI